MSINSDTLQTMPIMQSAGPVPCFEVAARGLANCSAERNCFSRLCEIGLIIDSSSMIARNAARFDQSAAHECSAVEAYMCVVCHPRWSSVFKQRQTDSYLSVHRRRCERYYEICFPVSPLRLALFSVCRALHFADKISVNCSFCLHLYSFQLKLLVCATWAIWAILPLYPKLSNRSMTRCRCRHECLRLVKHYTSFIHQRTGSKVKKKRNTGNKLKWQLYPHFTAQPGL